jgi:hypothetical protein
MQRSAWMLLAPLLALAGCSDPPPPPPEQGEVSSSDGGVSKPAQPSDRVNWPATVPAAEANLADDDVVVGVVVGSKARAYRLNAFKYIDSHVVNDVVNKTAVTVTYCDRDDCLRVYTDDREEPLPIGVGGFREGLLLRIGNSSFEQKTGKRRVGGETPPRSMPFERTSWGEWKKAHADTDVYLGRSAPRRSLSLPLDAYLRRRASPGPPAGR